MLHVAPEACLSERFKQHLGEGYVSADLHRKTAMVKMDITHIDYPDEHFDIVYCSHVLEHVPDDIQAMREFYRVLKSNGWAVLLVPITAAKTYEDPSITTPEGRLAAFGQFDHVRRYGPDYIDRLRSVGFKVSTYEVADLVQAEEAIRFGISKTRTTIYLCSRQ